MKTTIKNALIYDSKTASFYNGSLTFGEKITENDGADLSVDVKNAFVIPGFVDVHTHGRSGFDFNYASEKELSILAESYLSTGVTSLMPTLASDTLENLKKAADRINAAKKVGYGSVFAGIHLEGRYLNPQKRGAHAEDLLATPDASEIEDLIFRMRLPCHISSALELDDGSFAKKATELGATLGLAHTMADYATALELYEKYKISFTHLFNAMPPLNHRNGGAVAAGLTSGAFCEIICDGIHLSPETVLLAYRCLGAEKLSLITDSMEAAGCPDGNYSIAGTPCILKDGSARTPEGNLAGSVLDMKTAVENLMKFCKIPFETALLSATLTPARQMKIDDKVGSLEVGKYADLLVVRLDNGKIKIEQIYKKGELFSPTTRR